MALNVKRWESLKEISEKVSTPALADALDGMGGYGFVNNELKVLSSKSKLFGQAYTVHWEPVRKLGNIKKPQSSTWDQVKDFLIPEIDDGTGRVYVAGCGNILKEMALAGGMSCEFFSRIGFEGVVVGGAVRDANLIKNSDIPIFGSNFTPMDTQGCFRVSSVGKKTVIGSSVIYTGMWIMGDESGIVAVEDHLIKDVLSTALKIEQIEEDMMKKIRFGNNLIELVDGKEGRI